MGDNVIGIISEIGEDVTVYSYIGCALDCEPRKIYNIHYLTYLTQVTYIVPSILS